MNSNLTLTVSSFRYSNLRKDSYFENILKVCIQVYNCIVQAGIKLPNNENEIRDTFLKYLQDPKFKSVNQLSYVAFDKEIQDIASGRVDIRILPTQAEFVDEKACYIIECKRLDNQNLHGITGLNAEYVKNGVCRFTSEYYYSHFGCNGMFGFLVASISNVQTDIVDNINTNLNISFVNAQNKSVTANSTQLLTYVDFANQYPYTYISKHTRQKSQDELTLYHVMFDFSNNLL